MAKGDFIDTDLLEDESRVTSTLEGASPNLRAKFTSKEEEARQKLEEIRRQMEDLERQRLENADLTRRLEELEKNKGDLHHQLDRTIGVLENNEMEISKQLNTVSSVRKSIQEQLSRLEQIREESWSGDSVRQRLQDATETLEEARSESNRGRQQLVTLDKIDIESTAVTDTAIKPQVFDFKQELLRGLAWTLPLIIAILAAAILGILIGAKG